jgi:hypothetical protein
MGGAAATEKLGGPAAGNRVEGDAYAGLARGVNPKTTASGRSGAILTSCGPRPPCWKIPRRRGGRCHTIQPRRRVGGRHEKGSDRDFFLNAVYFMLNFAKKAIFIVF